MYSIYIVYIVWPVYKNHLPDKININMYKVYYYVDI